MTHNSVAKEVINRFYVAWAITLCLGGKHFARWRWRLRRLSRNYCSYILGWDGGRMRIWQGRWDRRADVRNFYSVSKKDRRELARLSVFLLPILIGLQPLTQSARPSNTLHLLHNNTQTHVMMYEQSDALQNTECSSPESLGTFLLGHCLCMCVHLQSYSMCVQLWMSMWPWLIATLERNTLTWVCAQFPVKRSDRAGEMERLPLKWHTVKGIRWMRKVIRDRLFSKINSRKEKEKHPVCDLRTS